MGLALIACKRFQFSVLGEEGVFLVGKAATLRLVKKLAGVNTNLRGLYTSRPYPERGGRVLYNIALII